jgi:cobalt-zinc-cadmium efflux system membrane fusion protein
MLDMLSAPLSRAGRALSRPVQLAILAGVAVAVTVVLLAVPLVRSWVAPREVAETAAPALPRGAFQATPQQWAGFKLAPVSLHTFRSEEVADGKIAVNDDHLTPVFSPYSGRVTKLLAKPGDSVESGAPLAMVEASEFVQAQNDLIAAAAQLGKSRSQLALAETNEKRQRGLLAAKAGALKDLQQAVTELASARADLRSSETALGAVRNRLRILGKSDEEIATIEAAGKVSAAAPVTAPIAGTVMQRKVGLGQYIAAAASDPIFTIGNLSTVWLIANVRESDAPKMHPGDAVEVRVLAWPGRVFTAKLTYVAPSVDPTTRRLPVRAEVENPDGALKPEMFASFGIITGADRSAPAVPADAVVYEGAEAHVWVAGEDRTVMARTIRAGRSADGLVEAEGVEPGETVVESGTLFIDRAARGE